MDEDTSNGTRHISTLINRSANDVYRYASDPAKMPDWAAGLAESELTRVGDSWVTQSPMGEITIDFSRDNDFGILDHTVILPSGESVYNPMRVIPAGEGRSEAVFSLRRQPGFSDDEFEADASAVAADLARLKRILET